MEQKLKLIISIVGWLVILLPFSFLFIIFGTISLEMGFGISPPIGLATASFVLAMMFSAFWRIGSGFKPFFSRFRNAPPKRILRVRFLQQREQTQ